MFSGFYIGGSGCDENEFCRPCVSLFWGIKLIHSPRYLSRSEQNMEQEREVMWQPAIAAIFHHESLILHRHQLMKVVSCADLLV